MKKKECPSCAMEVDAASDICPVCQYEFPARPNALTRWLIILLVLLFVLLIIFGF